jgi:hypothetical protein
MSNFNYYDNLRTGPSQKWISYLNERYIKLYAPPIKIFKLDKKATILDELYGEVKSSRIYLPPFEMRGFHLDNKWAQMVGSGTMPYLEPEEDIQIVVNFEDMIKTIRDIKNHHISDIYISYSGNKEPIAFKNNNIFTIREDMVDVAVYDLNNTSYNTTKKLSIAINTLANFSTEFSGDNDSSLSLVSFNETRFKYNKLQIYSPDITYQNITEVIEKGDIVLTNKWKVYEVLNNMPGGNFGWDYATFVLTCNLRELDKTKLPQNYIEQIKRHEYSLRDKIDLE